MMRRVAAALLLSSWIGGPLLAQEPSPVGKGSYAEFPPPSAGQAAAEMVRREFPLVDPGDRPIPTNQYWTWLLNGKPSGNLWLYPWRVDPKETGLELFLPLKWNANGSDPVCESPLRVGGVDFRAKSVQVKAWGDWTLSFRLKESDDRYLDVTVGEGMPLVWVEAKGVDLRVQAEPDARFTPAKGGPQATAESLLVASAGRHYGVYSAPGTRFARDGAGVRIAAAKGRAVAAFAALKQPADLGTFARSALAVPRDSRVDWSFDAKRGKVTTTWTVRTEPLVPGLTVPDVVAQGWLAHHWRGAGHRLNLDGPEYLTSRGPLKTAVGNRFELVYDFEGVLPYLPAPAKLGVKDDFDPARMSELLARRAKNPKYGDDSYWGGKDLLQFAQYLHMAKELNDPSAPRLRELARKSLADWLTYTPGEAAHYFTRYKNWHALIGIKDSYDSARFNDQHFHYGYFTLSTALLAMDDPGFLRDYGEMIRLVAKQYANWDRKDSRFPLFRTFDLWAGHSWAGGLGSPGGNNQESTSEAMQSWIGLFLLGTMLDDPAMTAAGAMGYAMESRATLEYWFNIHGDLFPREYQHPIVGVLWSGGLVFGTYFSGDPAWVYAIQCLPQSPGLDYLVRNQAWARSLFFKILALRKQKEGTDELGKMGDLGNVMLMQASLVDPEWAAQQFDKLWAANNPIVRETLDAARGYYQAHAYRKLGPRAWDVRLSLPTGAAYRDPRGGVTTYVAYNPKPYPVVVEAMRGETLLGEFVAPPSRLTSVTRLTTGGGAAGLAGSVPADGDGSVDRRTDSLALVFRAPVDPASLAGIRLEGPGASALEFRTEDQGRVAIGRLAGPLRPGASYRLLLPASLRTKAGAAALPAARSIAFTVEPQPPLALEQSVPSDGQGHVDPARPELVLAFNAPMDPKSLGRIRLEGPGAPAVTPRPQADGWRVRLDPAAPLRPDESYALVVPSGVSSAFGQALAADRAIRFTTAPLPCPPNVYRESFAGGGFGADPTLEVDLHNSEAPHSGRYAIKLHAPSKEGTVYLFNGTSDHGDGRVPVDLRPYRRIEFWMKGTARDVWVKIGHPVFDEKAFTQTHVEGVTNEYRRYGLDVPAPKGSINTLLVVSVPAGQTVFLDDIRFVGDGPAPAARRPTGKPSARKK